MDGIHGSLITYIDKEWHSSRQMQDAEHHVVNARTGWPTVSILWQGEREHV